MKKSRKLLFWLLISTLLVLLAAGIFIQSSGGKEWIKNKLIIEAKNQGFSLEIETISGDMPFHWKLKNIRLKNKKIDISTNDLEITLSPIGLLTSKLSINNLYIGKTSVTLLKPLEKIAFTKIPKRNTLLINRLKSNDIIIKDLNSKQIANLSLKGKIKLREKNLPPYLLLQIKDNANGHTIFDCSLQRGKYPQDLSLNLFLHLDAEDSLSAVLPFKTTADLNIQIEGPWQSWNYLVNKNSETENLRHPLEGKITLTTDALSHPKDERFWPIYSLLQEKTKTIAFFAINQDNSLTLSDLHFKNNQGELKAQGHFLKRNGRIPFSLENGSFNLCFSDISLRKNDLPLPIKGSLSGSGTFFNAIGEISLTAHNLLLGENTIPNAKAHFIATKPEGFWQGVLDIAGEKNSAFPLEGHLEFLKKETLFFPTIDLVVGASSLSSSLEIDVNRLFVKGPMKLHLSSLKHLGSIFSKKLQGELFADLSFSYDDFNQYTKGSANAHYFSFGSIKAQEVHSSFDLRGTYHQLKGTMDLEAENFRIREQKYDSCCVALFVDEKGTEIALKAAGDSTTIQAEGSLKQPENTKKILTLTRLWGKIENEEILLKNPFVASWDKEEWKIDPFLLNAGLGSLKYESYLSKNKASVAFSLSHFPLSIFGFSPLKLKGTISGEGNLLLAENKKSGRVNLTLEKAAIGSKGKKKPTKAKGHLQLNLENDHLQFFTDIQASNSQFMNINGTLPLTLSFMPLLAEIKPKEALHADLLMEGRAEEIFDFLALSSHSLSGHISSKLIFSNTFEQPNLLGSLELQGGSYENYFSGTRLGNIYASAESLGSNVNLKNFEARTFSFKEGRGYLHAKGDLNLNLKEKCPFNLKGTLEKMRCIDTDTIQSDFSGEMEIIGNWEGARMHGRMDVPYAHVTIPDKLTQTTTELDYQFINRPLNLESFSKEKKSAFPLDLSLSLVSTGKLIVEGRNLHSEWKGKAELTGRAQELKHRGEFTLEKGEYQFGGKSFELKEGTILFSEKYKDGATLSLSGTLALPEAAVNVYLRGDLLSPSLSFESVPPMPTTSILARILFNKDIGEISPIEALHLAQVVVSLSGEAGLDLLETLRKNLGVDRLSIAPRSTESTGDGVQGGIQGGIVVQIGKYIADGVLVTYTQNGYSSQVMVEVELTKGFVLQAETQEEGAGKFTLKWGYQY